MAQKPNSYAHLRHSGRALVPDMVLWGVLWHRGEVRFLRLIKASPKNPAISPTKKPAEILCTFPTGKIIMSANIHFELLSLAIQAQLNCDTAPPVRLVGRAGVGKK